MIIVDKKKYGMEEESHSKKVIYEDVIREGFRGEKVAQSVEKLMNVVSRRAGVSVTKVSKVPDFFANKNGSFIGFFILMGNGKLVRFNMEEKGRSADFHSVDIMDTRSMEPKETLSLEGNNVVEVVDFVADFVNGSYRSYQESAKKYNSDYLREAVTYPECLRMWTQLTDVSRELTDILKRPKKSDVNAGLEIIRPRFEEYRESLGVRGSMNPDTAFRYTLNKILKEDGGNTKNLAVAEVVPSQSENLVSRGGAEEEAYNELMKNEHIFKFKALRLYCNQIKANNKDFKSLYVYGMGGIGKSHWVKVILGPLPQTTYITGRIKGYTGLVKVLFENRDGKILVLDDTVTDNDMANQSIGNILKAALDPAPPRIISVERAYSRESRVKNGVISLNEKDYSEFIAYKKSLKESETIDIATPIDSPDRFEFNASTVFLTNYRSIPQPIKDRCWTLKMFFSNEQVIDLIKESLKETVPESEFEYVADVYKDTGKDVVNRDVIEFMESGVASGSIKRELSYRIFHRLVALRSLGLADKSFERALMWMELGN